jgi:hypothetical protein
MTSLVTNEMTSELMSQVTKASERALGEQALGSHHSPALTRQEIL